MNHERSSLKWPDGWERTRISDRKPMASWKSPLKKYEDALLKELSRLGVVECLITYNSIGQDRLDPGVAVYFSRQKKVDYSWQEALGLNTPVPTLADIDDAYRRLAMQHHPDRGGDITTFRQITKHRDDAKAWIMGTQNKEHEYVIPCDRFAEVRLNINAIRTAMAAMRQLDRVGIPGMLERSFRGMKTALAPGKDVTA